MVTLRRHVPKEKKRKEWLYCLKLSLTTVSQFYVKICTTLLNFEWKREVDALCSGPFYYIHGVACDVFVDPFKVPTYVLRMKQGHLRNWVWREILTNWLQKPSPLYVKLVCEACEFVVKTDRETDSRHRACEREGGREREYMLALGTLDDVRRSLEMICTYYNLHLCVTPHDPRTHTIIHTCMIRYSFSVGAGLRTQNRSWRLVLLRGTRLRATCQC
jgi:hypothetical protein